MVARLGGELGTGVGFCDDGCALGETEGDRERRAGSSDGETVGVSEACTEGAAVCTDGDTVGSDDGCVEENKGG